MSIFPASLLAGLALAVAAASALAAPGETTLVSLSPSGAIGDGQSNDVAITADGRFVAFGSNASNLVANDINGVKDVFVRDRLTGAVERVSVSTAGVPGNSTSFGPAISPDGRLVAFASFANNLVATDSNGFGDVFVRDRQAGTTTRVSVATGGAQSNDSSYGVALSPDARFVLFTSLASNLVATDTNASTDVFTRDLQTGVTARVSVGNAAVQGNSHSAFGSMTADNRFVAFESVASNFVAGDTALSDVFVRDLALGTIARVSGTTAGQVSNGSSFSASIAANGTRVAFASTATNLGVADANVAFADVYVKNLPPTAAAPILASVASGGAQGNNQHDEVRISADGRFVAFRSSSTNYQNLGAAAANNVWVRDLTLSTLTLASVRSDGTTPGPESGQAVLSGDGKVIAFSSLTETLADNDGNGVRDVFVRDVGAWSDLGFAKASPIGSPVLYGVGSLAAGSLGFLTLEHAAPAAPSVLFLSASSTPVPNFFGGTLVAFPVVSALALATNGSGQIPVPFTMPAGVPASVSIYFQYVIGDPGASLGISLSNGLKAVTP